MAKRKLTQPTISTADERIVGTRELLERVLPVNRTTLWGMVRDGKFPRPIRLTRHRIGWRWSSILQWLAEREANPLERREYPSRDKSG